MKQKKRLDLITRIAIWVFLAAWSFVELFQPGNGLHSRLFGILGFLCVGLSIAGALKRRRQQLRTTPPTS